MRLLGLALGLALPTAREPSPTLPILCLLGLVAAEFVRAIDGLAAKTSSELALKCCTGCEESEGLRADNERVRDKGRGPDCGKD